MFGGKRLDHELAGDFEFVARNDANQVRGHAAAVKPLNRTKQHLHPLDGLGRQVDRGRLHLHHPPTRHEHRQCRHVVQMDVTHKPRWAST